MWLLREAGLAIPDLCFCIYWQTLLHHLHFWITMKITRIVSIYGKTEFPINLQARVYMLDQCFSTCVLQNFLKNISLLFCDHF